LKLLLGQRDGSDEPVHWRVSIQGNPHLLIVGLPGMGKTTCLIQLCRQLMAGGIAPIVFSYHEDIDEKLGDLWGDSLRKVSYAGLGFQPFAGGERCAACLHGQRHAAARQLRGHLP
jgi:DNA phosphorothioation-dependent restriction protein DptH